MEPDQLSADSRAARFDAEYGFDKPRARLRRHADRILRDPGSLLTKDDGRLVGIEIEASCLTPDGPLPEAVRNELVESEWRWGRELGAAQIEVRTRAIDIAAPGGFGDLKDAVRQEDERLERRLAEHRAVPIRAGTDPIVRLDESIRTQVDPERRYSRVPNFHQRHRLKGLPPTLGLGAGQVPADHTRVVGALSAIHLTVDCHSFEEAVDLLNRSFVASPFALALGANARFLDGVDTGFSDIRLALWQVSHDIRTYGELARGLSPRVGLPTEYHAGLADYFADLHDQPSIFINAEDALVKASTLSWRDGRIKLLRSKREGEKRRKLALEFRPLSTQPSAFEDYAILLFGLGHMFGSRRRALPLPPLERVHDNRWAAMLDGTRGALWSGAGDEPRPGDGRQVLRREVELAAEGLAGLGAGEDDVGEVREVWDRRLADGCPADRMAAAIAKLAGSEAAAARPGRQLLADYFRDRG